MKPEETNISKIIDILEDYFGNPEELEDWTTIKMQELFIEAAMKIDELYKTIQLNDKTMKTAIDIELREKVGIALYFNFRESLSQLDLLFDLRKQIASIIVETNYQKKEPIDMFNQCEKNIKELLGL